MTDRFDIVVAGAGHNSLVAAAYLAKAGYRCLVLEGRSVLGGNVVTEELTLPGFRHDSCSSAHVLIQSNPLIRDDEPALQEELNREMGVFGKTDPPAYFLSYTVTDNDRSEVTGSNGALLSSGQQRSRWLVALPDGSATPRISTWWSPWPRRCCSISWRSSASGAGTASAA